jgi:hypothetical protein
VTLAYDLQTCRTLVATTAPPTLGVQSCSTSDLPNCNVTYPGQCGSQNSCRLVYVTTVLTPPEMVACASQSQPNWNCPADALMWIDLRLYGFGKGSLSSVPGGGDYAASGAFSGGAGGVALPSTLSVAAQSYAFTGTSAFYHVHDYNQATYVGLCPQTIMLLRQDLDGTADGPFYASLQYTFSGQCSRAYFVWTSMYAEPFTGSPPPPG